MDMIERQFLKDVFGVQEAESLQAGDRYVDKFNHGYIVLKSDKFHIYSITEESMKEEKLWLVDPETGRAFLGTREEATELVRVLGKARSGDREEAKRFLGEHANEYLIEAEDWTDLDCDRQGNRLAINKYGSVHLKLASEKHSRHIGQWDAKRRILRKSVQEEHVFQKLQAFGFCDRAIRILDPWKIQIVYTNHGVYSIIRKRFEENKQYLHFKERGFERQCFVAIDKFIKRKD